MLALVCLTAAVVSGSAASGLVAAAPVAGADGACGVGAPASAFRATVDDDEQAAQIWRLYAAYFQRQPDPAGFDFWRGQHRVLGGEAIADAFADSEEFRQRFGRLGDDAFVELVYAHVLCRRPDAAGRTFWRSELRRGVTRGSLMLAFSDSLEFRLRTSTAPNPVAPIWSEEFDGGGDGWAGLRTDRWSVGTGVLGGHNGELQCFRQENVRVRDGVLHLTARDQQVNCDAGPRAYTSGLITTDGNASWTYGRFEVRARFPAEFGLWPAIWMLPTDRTFGPWPNSGEMDIVEAIGRSPDHVVGTAHWLGPDGAQMSNGWYVGGGEYIADWHTYTLEWSPRRLVWSVDGVAYHEVSDWNSVVGGAGAPFDQRFHLVLSLAVGGGWPQAPNATTDFPATMEVDWVRVYRG